MEINQIFGKFNASDSFNTLAKEGAKLSFSQFGEDLVAIAILSQYSKIDSGFYVDIGAHHPWKYSNTALLWKFFNWHGICVDADESAIKKIQNERNRSTDINLTMGIGKENSEAIFTIYNHPAVNTFDQEMVTMYAHQQNCPFIPVEKRTVQISTLENLFNTYLPKNTQIDFLSIDIEGLDYIALTSNNWQKYRPFLIAVETHKMNLAEPNLNDTVIFLNHYGYRLISHCYATSFFIRSNL
jgi:FkbM family methyltransferase